MGAIYKALERAAYLQPVANAIGDMVSKKKKADQMQQYHDLMTGYSNSINNIMNPDNSQPKVVPSSTTPNTTSALANLTVNANNTDPTLNPTQIQPTNGVPTQTVAMNNATPAPLGLDNSNSPLANLLNKVPQNNDVNNNVPPPVTAPAPKDSTTAPVGTPQTTTNPIVPVQNQQIDQPTKNKLATLKLIQAMQEIDGLDNVDMETKKSGLGQLQMLIQANQPPASQVKIFKSGDVGFRTDENGKFLDVDKDGKPIPIYDNSKEDTPKGDKPFGGRIEDANGHLYDTFIKADNTTYLKDAVTQKILTPEEAAKLQFKKTDGGTALGWANYYRELSNDKENRQDKIDLRNEKLTDAQNQTQSRYDEMLNAERLPLDDLVSRGLVQTTDKTAKGYIAPDSVGGAYLSIDKGGKAHVFTTEKELRNYALSNVGGNVPNKWERTEPTFNDQTKQWESKVIDHPTTPNATVTTPKVVTPKGNKPKIVY